MCRELLGRSARFEIAVAIRKTNHAIGIGDVQKLRIVTRWIKSDPERLVQISFRKSFGDIRFAIAVCIAQHLYLIRATFYHEDVSIRRAEEESRVAKATGIQFDFEPWRNFGLRVSWPVDNAGSINCQSIRAWWRQILNRDFAHDAGRIARPIAHRLFTGK